MKLICLNTWGGQKENKFFSFIKKHSDVDVFCFQEVLNAAVHKRADISYWDSNLFEKLCITLPNHRGLFNYQREGAEGIAMFVKKDLMIKKYGSEIVHKCKVNDNVRGAVPRALQWIIVENNGNSYLVSHLHGLWDKSGIDDIPKRIKQSKKVKSFLDSMPYPKIFCGDLNVSPTTKSIEMIKEEMRELVAEKKVKTTRSKLFVPSNHIVNSLSDYMFISKDINVKEFEVIQNSISDHFPLYLEFE